MYYQVKWSYYKLEQAGVRKIFSRNFSYRHNMMSFVRSLRNDSERNWCMVIKRRSVSNKVVAWKWVWK